MPGGEILKYLLACAFEGLVRGLLGDLRHHAHKRGGSVTPVAHRDPVVGHPDPDATGDTLNGHLQH
jgi:hypothetical protein